MENSVRVCDVQQRLEAGTSKYKSRALQLYLKLRLKVAVDWPKVQSLGYLQVLNVYKKFYENPHNVSRILCSWFRASLIKFLIIVQRDATLISLFIILQVHSTCFGCQPHPSSGVHKTVTTASGTGHMFVQLPPSDVAKLAWHPKHVEWTCRIINRLISVASFWTIIKNVLTFISEYTLHKTSNLHSVTQIRKRRHGYY